MNQYTHIGRLFYFDADISHDVDVVELSAGEHKATARKLFWRFYWLTTTRV